MDMGSYSSSALYVVSMFVCKVGKHLHNGKQGQLSFFYGAGRCIINSEHLCFRFDHPDNPVKDVY
jgi:hypothetical protein